MPSTNNAIAADTSTVILDRAANTQLETIILHLIAYRQLTQVVRRLRAQIASHDALTGELVWMYNNLSKVCALIDELDEKLERLDVLEGESASESPELREQESKQKEQGVA